MLLSELSKEERFIVIQGQLGQLGSLDNQPKVTCYCGRTVPVQYIYRCLECGVFLCRVCAVKHFG